MPYNPIALQLVNPINEVFPHQILHEGKGRDRRLFHHFETRNLADCLSHLVQDSGHIHPRIVHRQLRLELRQVAIEVLLQHLQQRGVETNFVFMAT